MSINGKNPLVSVIIPTYNHARFVGQAVNSALVQTYPDIEVVVVDDGSTDKTQEVLAKYEGQIIYIYQDNKGLSAARNTGILAAQGDYFLFLDADDLIPANKLELQVPLLNAQVDSGLIYSGWYYIDENGSRILGEMRPHKQGPVLEDLLRRTFFFPPGAALVRGKCFDQVGLFNPACPSAADTDMWVRIAKAGFTFGYIDQPLFQYRLVKGSMSSNIANQARDEFTRLDVFFADPELPENVKALKAEAYSILHYETATKYYGIGEIKLGQEQLVKAISTCPSLSLNKEWLLEWIAGYSLNPTVGDSHQLLRQIFDNLPQEAVTLRSLRRRAYGRYHIAAAFSAYHNQQLRDVRRHIWPAIMGDPAIVQNRGFLRIAAQSLLG